METVEVAAVPRRLTIGGNVAVMGVAGGTPGGVLGGIIGSVASVAPRQFDAGRLMAPPPPPVKAMAALDRKDLNTATLAKKEPVGDSAAHVRSYFPEALYINPEIVTDRDGRASIAIRMAGQRSEERR